MNRAVESAFSIMARSTAFRSWPFCGKLFDNVRGHRVAYWGGNGGSLGFVDFDERMAVSVVMNRWVIGAYEFVRNQRILKAAYDCVARK